MSVKKEIILNVRRNDVRVALRENGDLTQFFIERGDKKTAAGNIIKGRITSIRNELNAAFVNIGTETAGFLPLKDLYNSMPGIKGNEDGAEILVQIKKEPYQTKGARLTAFISIPGRYLVLLPFKRTIGISKNIRDNKERNRLKNIAKKIVPERMGIIIRTQTSGKSFNVLKSDLNYLLKTWDQIQRRSKVEPAPSIVWEDEELPIKMARDLLDESVSDFIVDSKRAYKKIKAYLRNRNSGLSERVKLYQESAPIFNHYKIEQEMRSIFRRKVFLKSGGHIVIDETEALTVFDVNTGSYKGRKNTEKMILNTNTEASEEIARQLKLRDIGGIIIIDFIDMHNKKNEKRLLSRFRNLLKQDKAGFKMPMRLSPNGLLELTRERVRRSIAKRFVVECPYCLGKGHVLSGPYLLSRFTTWLENKKDIIKNTRVRIIANPRISKYFETEGKEILEHACSKNKMKLEIVSRDNQPIESVEILTGRNGEVIKEEL